MFFYSDIMSLDMTTSTKEWNRLGLGVLILIVGFALLAAYFGLKPVLIIGVAVIVLGVYLLITSMFKDKEVDQMGTSDSCSTLWLGSLITSAGLAVLIYGLIEDWMVGIAVFLIAMAVYIIFTVGMKKR